MSNKRIDILGNRYGRTTVVGIDEELSKLRGETMWICQCDCGNIHVASGSSLRRGHVKSCGCLKKELELKSRKTPEVYLNDEKGYGVAFLVNDKDKDDFVPFDSEDVDIIKSAAWSRTNDGYIRAYERGSGPNEKYISLHRSIMSKYEDITDKDVDHIYHNKSDVRKENMRTCTRQENNYNRRSPKQDNPEHLKNICYNKSNKSWQVGIKINGKNKIHQCRTKEEAIEYRDNFIKNNGMLDEFMYDENVDSRYNNCRDFHIGGSNGKLHPFAIVENLPGPNPEDIIEPFILINPSIEDNPNQNKKP